MTRRRNGEGSIYKITGGRWRAVSADRRIYRIADTAREAAAARDSAMLEQGLAAPTASAKQPVRDFLAAWLASKRKTIGPGTARMYEILARVHINPALGSIALGDLLPHHIDTLLTAVAARGLSPATVRHVHRLISQALAEAVLWGAIPDNPARRVKAPPKRKGARPIRPLTPDEVELFLTGISGDRDEALVLILLLLGLRRGEVLALRWSDIELGSGRLMVAGSLQRIDSRLQILPPKTRASRRTLKMPEVVVAALQLWREVQTAERITNAARRYRPLIPSEFADLVFTNRRMLAREPRGVYTCIQALMASSGIPVRTVHALRHTAATMLLRRRLPIKTVQSLLGHTSAMTTLDTYAHLMPDMLDEAATEMDAIVAARGATVA